MILVSATLPGSLTGPVCRIAVDDSVTEGRIVVGLITRYPGGQPLRTDYKTRTEWGEPYFDAVKHVVDASVTALGARRGSVWVFMTSTSQVDQLVGRLGVTIGHRQVVNGQKTDPQLLLNGLDEEDAVVVAAMSGRFGFGADLRGDLRTVLTHQTTDVVLTL